MELYFYQSFFDVISYIPLFIKTKVLHFIKLFLIIKEVNKNRSNIFTFPKILLMFLSRYYKSI